MPRALALVAAFALVVYALADFASSDEQDRGGIPRWLWLVIIVVLPYFGPVAWIVFSRSRRAQAAGGPRRPGAAGGRGRRRPSGPVAPDDDPDFLWRLAQEQRRQGRGPAGAPDPTSPTDPTGPAGPTGTDTPGADRDATDEGEPGDWPDAAKGHPDR